jgi:hypothetical protein
MPERISLYQPSSLCQFGKERDGRPRRTKDAECCKACNLSASLAVSAAKRMYSPSPVPRRQPSRPIPMPMQPSIAFHQNCCTAGTPISQSPCSHLPPHPVPSPTLTHSPTHPHGEQDEKASVRPSLHNKCSFKPPQPVSIGPPPACKIGQMSRMPFHSEDKHSFTTSSPTLEIGLNRPQRGDAGSDRLATGRVGGRCAV